MRSWRSLGSLGVVLLGCNRSALPIGEAAEDNVPWASSELFAHYRGALDGATTVGDLIQRPLTFRARPTPRALLQAQQAANPPAAANAETLTVVSYNVALLDVTLFGFVPFTATPSLDARRAVIAQTIFTQGYDIIAMQELWGSDDLARFRAAAEANGYWLVSSPRDGSTDGLAIAVRRTVAAGPAAQWSEPYAEIDATEFFPAPGLSRGFLAARFQSATLGPVVVYTTHTAAFPSAYQLRMRHARELGLDVRARVQPRELLFLLGDFNAAPYYRADSWALPAGATPGWYANTLSYPVILHYTGATDLALRGRSAADADLDITAGDAVPNNPAAAMQTPFGTPGYCATAPRDAFSATDCNSLYFAQYAATEFPARLDYVFGRDPDRRMHVVESRLVFTDPVAYGGGSGPLSDHYGQLVRLRVARP